MSKTSFKVDEIAEMQYVCKKILVQVLMDYVRQHGKAATPKNCRRFHLEDGDGDHVLTVLDLGYPSPVFTLVDGRMVYENDAPANVKSHRIYCLYIIEDEYDRQWLMYFGDDARDDYPHTEHESLLNKPLAFVSAIADIVKTI